MFPGLRLRDLQQGGDARRSDVAELRLHLPHRQPGSVAACVNN